MTYKLNLLKINSTDIETIEEQANEFAVGVIEKAEETGKLQELIGALCADHYESFIDGVNYCVRNFREHTIDDIAFYAVLEATVKHNS